MKEQVWPAAVKSRTVDGALVMYPVVVTIDGKETELSLDDARRLLAGLTAAVEVLAGSEGAAWPREREHLLIYAPTRSGMSITLKQ